jgi:hypothetical protein
MRKQILAATTAFILGGITTGALLAQAQPAPQATAAAPDAMPRPWMHGPRAMHRMHGRAGMMQTFALVYKHADRQLTPPDVQKIAEAFLLWRGNHSWKVVDVAPTPEGPIAFSLATQEGSVVAKFTMDAHTGRIARLS